MKETDIECEETCPFFRCLPDCERPLNRRAREVATKGKDFSGLLKTLCGPCAKRKKANDALDEAVKELLHGS